MNGSVNSPQDNLQPQLNAVEQEQLRMTIVYLQRKVDQMAKMMAKVPEHRKDGYRPCNCQLCRN